VNFNVYAYDIAGEPLTPTFNFPSGTTFPLGVTTIITSATDSLGNSASSAFTITVLATTPPTISLPANLTVEANAAGGAQVTLPQATATDPLDPSPTVIEDHSSGFFHLGTTTVLVTASDAFGNTSTGIITVTVVD